jgi:hypothetical protein
MNVLRNDYNRAITAKSSLTMAIQALHASLKFISDKKRLNQINEAIGILEQELIIYDEIIERINLLMQNFDKTLITHASNRIYQIDGLLKWNQGIIARKQKSYEDRANDSRAQRIPFEQFRPLDAEPTDADRANVAAERAALLEEQALLHEFLKDGALFDIDRLKSTSLASLIPA